VGNRRVGLEGELYRNNFTFSAIAGWKNTGKHVFLDTRAAYYLSANLKAYVGYELTDKQWYRADKLLYSKDLSIGKLGGEYMFDASPDTLFNGASVYAEAQVGQYDYRGFLVGLRKRFNDAPRSAAISTAVVDDGLPAAAEPDRSLKQRDRQDYAPIWYKARIKPKNLSTPTINACRASGQPCTEATGNQCCSGFCVSGRNYCGLL
jgi:hypothetical protein